MFNIIRYDVSNTTLQNLFHGDRDNGNDFAALLGNV